MIKTYKCDPCDYVFEFNHHPKDQVAECDKCKSTVLTRIPDGGISFSTIIPDYPGAKKLKAGYVHKFVNKPAEKAYVSVPSTILS